MDITGTNQSCRGGSAFSQQRGRGGANPVELIEHYAAWYVDPLFLFGLLPPTGTVLDAGTGYGWLAFALALRTRYHVVAMDVDERRLRATREIADILGIGERIEFVPGSVGRMPFADRQFDLSLCVEVLEHIHSRRQEAARDLARVTRTLLVVTTPNRSFPVIGHDTMLPFCHMLPLPLRDRYATWFGRQHLQEGNLFWSARELRASLPEFQRISRFLHFRDYPAYSVANGGGERGRSNPLSMRIGGRAKVGYYRLASLAGRNSDLIMPSLASTFRRRSSPA